MEWIDKLIGRVTEIRKAQAASSPAGADAGELAASVTEKLEAGELEPTEVAIKTFAKSAGLAEADADEFAGAVLDAYFTEDEDANPPAEEESDDKTEPVAKSEAARGSAAPTETRTVLKSIHSLSRRVDAIGLAVTELLDLLGQQSAAQQTLKTDVERHLQQEPPKRPVLKAGAGKPEPDRATLKRLILKGVQARALTPLDMALFESQNVLSDSARQYVETESK